MYYKVSSYKWYSIISGSVSGNWFNFFFLFSFLLFYPIGSLMKAITSTKLSPTCRYALVGYGVRLDGEVQDHPEK